MKRFLDVVLILILVTTVKVAAQDSSDDMHALEVDGHERIYYLHFPEKLNKNAPLIFVLHGYGGTANGMIKFSGMNHVADKNGFAVCYPQAALGDDDKNSWNAGYSNPAIDDVNYLCTLAEHLQKKYSLSKQNTFCTGMSNGADMCYMLACRSQEVFSAIASVAGCMMNHTFESCNPVKPIPMFEMHGTDDAITLWLGDPDYSKEYGGYKGVEESITLWINLNKCTDSKIDTLPNLSTTDSSFVVREVHTGGHDDHEVWLYTLVGGKHDWPGSRRNKDIIASDEIWKFFKLFIKIILIPNFITNS